MSAGDNSREQVILNIKPLSKILPSTKQEIILC
jgi:hypothetical protein